MAALARWCFHHRRMVLAIWLVALLGFGGDRPRRRRQLRQQLLAARHRLQPGPGHPQGQLPQPRPATASRSSSRPSRARLTTRQPRPRSRPCSTGWPSSPTCGPSPRPYGPGGQISKDGTIGLATVYLDALAQNVPKDAVNQLIDTAKSADSSVLNVQLGGNAIENNQQSGQSSSEGLGIIFALIVLFFAFRRSLLVRPAAAHLGSDGHRGRDVDHRDPHPRRGRPAVRTDPGHPGRARRRHRLRPLHRQPPPQRSAGRADARGRRRHRPQHLGAGRASSPG